MAYYAVVGFTTLLVLALGAWIFLRTRSLAFPLGILFVYYETLYGAWFTIYDKRGGSSGAGYGYLEEKMFPVALDGDYLVALALYSIFLIVFLLAAGFSTRSARGGPGSGEPALRLRHLPLLATGWASAAVSFLIVRGGLADAAGLEMSAYEYFRRGGGEVTSFYTVHQLLFRVAMFCGVAGLVATLSGPEPRVLAAPRTRRAVAGHAGLVLGMSALAVVMGSKSELFVAGVIGVLLYAANAPRPRWSLLVGAGTVLGAAMAVTDTVRSGAIVDASLVLGEGSAWDMLKLMTLSNEAFAAHFSMYGVLSRDVPVAFGWSLVSLVASLVPRTLWPDRPAEIYAYYAERVGAVPGQGYTIHHATAWYLNFGVLGVLLGALLLGVLWGRAWTAHAAIHEARSTFRKAVAAVAPWTITAYLMTTIRNGPEGYKGLLLEGVLFPAAVLALSSRRERAAGAVEAPP